MNPCPECAGAHMPDHPCGVLMFRHTNECALRASEDGRMVADSETGVYFTRPVTSTEMLLLAALGYSLPTGLKTSVLFWSPGVRVRTWPQLKEPTP